MTDKNIKKRTHIISKPTEGSRGETGLWRFSRPVVTRDECTKCSLCWIFCPENAIAVDDEGSPSIDYEYCKGCGICVTECPVDAIEMEEESE